jgi:hypothetical protein
MTHTHCPDCFQRLSEPMRPLGTFNGFPIWCATCEASRPKADRATIQAENESTRDAGELLAHFAP